MAGLRFSEADSLRLPPLPLRGNESSSPAGGAAAVLRATLWRPVDTSLAAGEEPRRLTVPGSGDLRLALPPLGMGGEAGELELLRRSKTASCRMAQAFRRSSNHRLKLLL